MLARCRTGLGNRFFSDILLAPYFFDSFSLLRIYTPTVTSILRVNVNVRYCPLGWVPPTLGGAHIKAEGIKGRYRRKYIASFSLYAARQTIPATPGETTRCRQLTGPLQIPATKPRYTSGNFPDRRLKIVIRSFVEDFRAQLDEQNHLIEIYLPST